MIKLFSLSLQPLFLAAIMFGVKVPDIVLDAFDTKFPSADEVIWDKVDDKTYTASFIFNDTLHVARFSDKGKWQETRKEIEYDSLPEKVINGFEKTYNVSKVKSVMRSESSTGKIKYVFEIKKLIKTEEVIFSELGKEQVAR